MRRRGGNFLDVIASLLSIGAGIYLLQSQSVGDEGNWFETLAHGIGVYFIAKGIFIARSAYLQSRTVEALEDLVAALRAALPPPRD